MNENVLKILNENMWEIATMGDEPDIAPVAFKAVLDENTLAVADVFLSKTVDNINANGKIILSAYDKSTMEGYKLRGKATHLTDGEIVETLRDKVSARTGGKLKVKGAVIVKIESIYATTPGASKEAL